MKKHRRIVFVILLGAVVGSAVWFMFYTREPVYQGKKLTVWLHELESPDPASPERKAAAHAVRQIGANALPFLLRMLQAHDPDWKVQTVSSLHDTFDVDLRESLASVHRQRAIMGFQVLGRVAEPSIPKLAALTSNSDTEVAAMAFLALTEIGGPKIIPPLLRALTNSNPGLRASAAFSIGLLQSQARDAVPVLVKALEENDAGLQAAAARALREIGLDGELAVPALTRALTNSDTRVRASAASALGAFGTQAESALPIILAVPGGQDEITRRSLTRGAVRVQCELRDGGIIRGPKSEPRLAIVFTGHEFAEGGETILDELTKHDGKGSFFLTGVFLDNPQFRPLIDRIVADGHLLGPHSDKHLLYCDWDKSRTLVSEEEFTQDLLANVAKLPARGGEERRFSRYFLPAYEHYNREIFDWTRKQRRTLINFTPGTRSNTDYTGEADKNFVSSQAIFDSIVKKEREDPHGLNGFILLLHIGSGPGRADKFHTRFGELLDYLAGKDYQFVRVDELLEPRPEGNNESRPKSISSP